MTVQVQRLQPCHLANASACAGIRLPHPHAAFSDVHIHHHISPVCLLLAIEWAAAHHHLCTMAPVWFNVVELFCLSLQLHKLLVSWTLHESGQAAP